jgi:hypothetical protein
MFNGGNLNGYQSITDVSTPGFAFLKKKGFTVMSPAIIERVSFDSSDDFMVAYGPANWGTRTWSGPMAALVVEDAGEQDNVADDLATASASVINNVYAKAYNGSAALSVSIGEGNETLHMIKRPLGRARDLIGKMIRRKQTLINKGIGVSKAMASAWLEYRLGFKPVLYDIQNIMDATVKQLIGNKTTEKQVARSSQTVDSFVSREHVILPQLHFQSGMARTSKTVNYKVSAGVLYETKLLSDDGIVSEKLRHNYGLQLRDVARTGWELTPFSFVVDRLVDVGSWLAAIQPNPNVSILGSWLSITRKARSTRQVLYLQVNTTPIARTGMSGEFSGRSETLTRVVGVAPSSIPPLNLGSLSLSQHVDHISLLVSMGINFRKRK